MLIRGTKTFWVALLLVFFACSAPARYLQADPIGLNGGWHRFGYAEANPLKYSDPTGLATYIDLPVVVNHLRWLAGLQGDDFATSPYTVAERQMLERLMRGEETEWDIAFYRHERAEADLCSSLRNLPATQALNRQLENHRKVLEAHKNREKDLYHPDVVFRNPKIFNKDWFAK